MLNTDTSDISKALIEKVGLKKSYASLLANGKKRPSLGLAVRIEAELGIPPRFWIERAAEAA